MRTVDARQNTAHLRRLQILLLLMILWNLFAMMVQLSFGGALMQIEGERIAGFLGAKSAFSGAVLVPTAVYIYGIVRNPIRHPGVVWVGMIEQGALIFFAAFHVAAGHMEMEAAIAPVLISLLLLFLLIVNLPRGAQTAA
jgi:hypothetical protein